MNYRDQLKNVSELRLHQYKYKEAYARTVDMADEGRTEMGVIAQEVQEFIPDAVVNMGDLELKNGDKIESLLFVDKVCEKEGSANFFGISKNFLRIFRT